MSEEGQLLDNKSLKTVTGKSADWDELVKDCVAFANASGGQLMIGIEDGESDPPESQKIPLGLLDTLRRRIAELSVNVTVLPDVVTADNGGQYINMSVPRSLSVASTTGGRYYLRVADQSKPVTGDDVLRLATERTSLPWETQTSVQVARADVDAGLLSRLVADLKNSDRVKTSVKEKNDAELLEHYLLAQGQYLTNLGVLCVGQQQHRSLLGTAPVIQFIKYDDHGRKVNKLVWDDYSLSPMQLIEEVWQKVPDFRERYELPDGLFRQHLPAYDEVVVRELLVNAIVHRPYTQRGDIFLSLFPDRLEIVNPGPLPLGVTARNILHTTVRRNEHMARLFHDLKLMEREGSGFDRIYEVLLSQGRPVPELIESFDRVQIIVRRRILKPEVIDFITQADEHYQLSQRERIVLGLLAQHETMTARELAETLELGSTDNVQVWLKRLVDWGVVQTRDRTKATRYYIAARLLQELDFTGGTTLKRIEPHRLLALIEEDVGRYPGTRIGQIHQRIGQEIPRSRVKRGVAQLLEEQRLVSEGVRSGTRYYLP